mmetsp:Transcript_42449/g.50943  ORF Transcript_42449/g.50943 Transcript_42449/m.50943 type:complete len:100 (-) Transcript_42449:86-385(-)
MVLSDASRKQPGGVSAQFPTTMFPSRSSPPTDVAAAIQSSSKMSCPGVHVLPLAGANRVTSSSVLVKALAPFKTCDCIKSAKGTKDISPRVMINLCYGC